MSMKISRVLNILIFEILKKNKKVFKNDACFEKSDWVTVIQSNALEFKAKAIQKRKKSCQIKLSNALISNF